MSPPSFQVSTATARGSAELHTPPSGLALFLSPPPPLPNFNHPTAPTQYLDFHKPTLPSLLSETLIYLSLVKHTKR